MKKLILLLTIQIIIFNYSTAAEPFTKLSKTSEKQSATSQITILFPNDDNKETIIPFTVAQRFNTVKNTLNDIPNEFDQPIPLLTMTKKTFDQLVELSDSTQTSQSFKTFLNQQTSQSLEELFKASQFLDMNSKVENHNTLSFILAYVMKNKETFDSIHEVENNEDNEVIKFNPYFATYSKRRIQEAFHIIKHPSPCSDIPYPMQIGALLGLHKTRILKQSGLKKLVSNSIQDLTEENYDFLRKKNNSTLELNDLCLGSLEGLQQITFIGSIKDLYFYNNKLEEIPEKTFYGLNLVTLSLHNNNFTKIPKNAFNGLTLKNLYLNSNYLTTIPENTFNGLTLNTLDLSKNKLTTIPENAFNGLTLNTLNLSKNKFTTLPENAFNGLTLKNLYLNNNNITTLPDNIFANLNELAYLNLSNTPITKNSINCEQEMRKLLSQVSTNIQNLARVHDKEILYSSVLIEH